MALQHLRSSTADKRPTPAAMSDGQLALNTNLVSPGLFFKDSNGDSVKIGPVHVGTTAPNATPGAGGQAGNSKGEAWLDTTAANPILKVWNGSAFVAVQPVGTGTVVSTTDSGTVTSTMILDGTIVNADINASAEIAVSKLEDGAARQLLQTDAAGTGVEWASNIDIPGTLDVTGATVFDSTVVVNTTGALTLPDGTTAQRPASPATGDIRFNTTVVQFEGYDGAAWGTIGGGGPLAGFRNAIINGNFDHWQRGTSQTAAGYGSADRYASNRVGTTCTMSRQAFTLGQTDVPGEPTYFCRMAVTSVAGAGNLSLLEQKIEGVRTFAGQQVTVSFWVKADAAKPISVELVESFGSGGSPSSGVDALGVSKVTLSTSWQKITTTVTLPSISGKTLGSDNNDAIVLRIWFDAGSTYNTQTDTLGQQSGTFDIAQVQIEAGPVATAFERRPIGTELALCQRYFCKSYNQSVDPGAITTAGVLRLKTFGGGNSSSSVEAFYPVVMRDTPSITVFSPDTGTSGQCSRDNVDQAAAAQAIGDYKAVINSNSTNTDSEMRAHFTASAEL